MEKQKFNSPAYAFDFDRTLVICDGDIMGEDQEKDWFLDSTVLSNSKELPLFGKFKKLCNLAEEVYIITGRGVQDKEFETKLIHEFLQIEHDIYLPTDQILCVGHDHTGLKKAEAVKQLIDRNNFDYFEFHDDKQYNIKAVDALNGYSDCKVNPIFETEWKNFYEDASLKA